MSTAVAIASPPPTVDEMALMKRADLPSVFAPFREEFQRLAATAKTLTVTEESDKAGMKLARETRLALKSVRLVLEKKRKELGEDALRRKQEIDSTAKEIRELIEVLETRLEEQEKFAERKQAQRKAELLHERKELLEPFSFDAGGIDLGAIDDKTFDTLFAGAKKSHEDRVAAEEKRLQDEKDKAEADRLDRELLAEENKRLQQQAEELRLEQRKKDAAAAEASSAAAAAAAKEREESAKEVARIAKIAEEQRQETATLFAEKQRRDAAEKQAQAEKDKAAREAASAGDAEKLVAFADAIESLKPAAMKSPKAQGYASDTLIFLVETARTLREYAAKL